jgi:hypothetical protein
MKRTMDRGGAITDRRTTTEELLGQVMAATFLLSLRRRWPSFTLYLEHLKKAKSE